MTSKPHSDLLAEGRRIAGWAPDKPESVHEVLCSAFKQLDAQYAALQAAIELIQNERDGLEEQLEAYRKALDEIAHWPGSWSGETAIMLRDHARVALDSNPATRDS